MSEPLTAETSISEPDKERFVKRLADYVLFLELVSASTHGVRACFWHESAATQGTSSAVGQSSTQLQKITPELQARLDTILDAARDGIIEDGMSNPINEQLPDLIAREPFNTVIPALASIIESGRTTPIVAAEVLKELGRIRSAASHPTRLWALERALSSPSPIVRDGAGLGLARLADPYALSYLRRALERERDTQMKLDLQLVIQELAETVADGIPTAEYQHS